MTRDVEDIHMDVIARPRTDRVVFVEPTVKHVRAMFGGETIADSRRVTLLFEEGHLPVYAIRVGDRVAPDAAWRYPEPIDARPDISEHVAFYWDAMDSWWEEDDQVVKRARDPYHRVDVLRSSRHVRVESDGTVVADTHRPLLLIETGPPSRWYVPRAEVRFDLLTPTDTQSTCPYKGVASHFTATIGDAEYEDIAWSYVAPWPECPKIEQAVCFFNERVDLTVDGERQERPKTHWDKTVEHR